MQVGDLSRTHVPCERRDNPALQTMRLLLVGGLIAGGSLALGLTGGAGSPTEGLVAAAPPTPAPVEIRNPAPPVQAAPVRIADARPAVPVAVSMVQPDSAPRPVAEPKDAARAPAEPPSFPVPVSPAAPQPLVVLKPVEAAVAKVSAPVPARTNDMNLTGAVAAPAKAAQPVKVASAVASSGASDAGLVDLNRGSLEDLNTLDGAGSLGKAIIRGRPYASVDDLVKKRVLRRTSFEKIKDQVTVQ